MILGHIVTTHIMFVYICFVVTENVWINSKHVNKQAEVFEVNFSSEIALTELFFQNWKVRIDLGH